MTDKPDGWALIRGKRQKIIKILQTRWEADYYGRAERNLRGWASYTIRPVKLVFLDEDKKDDR